MTEELGAAHPKLKRAAVQVEDKANRLRLGQPVTVRINTGNGGAAR